MKSKKEYSSEIEANEHYPYSSFSDTSSLGIEGDGHGNFFYRGGEFTFHSTKSGDSTHYFLSEEMQAVMSLIGKYSISDVRQETMSRLVIGYTSVNEAFAKHCLAEERALLKPSIMTQHGILGTGMYFYENNFDAAKILAVREKGVVLGAVLELKNCLDLMENKGQSQLELVYKDFLAKGLQVESDGQIFNALRKKSKVTIDSSRSYGVTNIPLYRGSSIYQSMFNIICIYSDSCVLRYFNPTDKENIPVITQSVK